MVWNMLIRLYGVVNDSIVDGVGLRFVIFTQGCLHHCIGCHNPKSHDINGGYEEDIIHLLEMIDQNPLLDGVTLSGGEPFLQPEPLIEFVKEVKRRHLHVMIYSGYTFEELMQGTDKQKELLALCDLLVDGRFDIQKRSLSLLYRGSTNQRIIDIQKTLQSSHIVLQEFNEFGEYKNPSHN